MCRALFYFIILSSLQVPQTRVLLNFRAQCKMCWLGLAFLCLFLFVPVLTRQLLKFQQVATAASYSLQYPILANKAQSIFNLVTMYSKQSLHQIGRSLFQGLHRIIQCVFPTSSGYDFSGCRLLWRQIFNILQGKKLGSLSAVFGLFFFQRRLSFLPLLQAVKQLSACIFRGKIKVLICTQRSWGFPFGAV